MLRNRAQDHAGLGLAAVAALRIGGKVSLYMVGAVVECVDVRAMRGKLRIHPVVESVHGSLVVVAARDAALIRDDDDEIAVFIRPANRFDCALDPDEFLRLVEIVHVDVERAVAVEEDRLIRHRRSTRPPSGSRSIP